MEVEGVSSHPQKVVSAVVEQEWVLDGRVDLSLANVLLAQSGREGIDMLDLVPPEDDLLNNLNGVESETQDQITYLINELSRRMLIFTRARFLLLLDPLDLSLVVEPYLSHAVFSLLDDFHHGCDLRSAAQEVHDLFVHDLDHHVVGLEFLEGF